ncbi:hypothetical protein HPP92_007362 [Vanilla planifolia]|uniref:Uncharacterized protein n=1 Tax=Vanilla planifolia TaxID=51239 RepID=A0A835RG86_VANPL|nr:hypothetical protein HPP92_007362 [Vanilla planifolia]
MGGKKILINSILSSMVSYCTAALNPPKAVIKAIDRRLSQFFWGESKDSFKHHWASWNRLARPVSESGIGIINLSVKVHAQTANLWWNFIHDDSPWACYMRDCYLSGRPSITNKPGDSPGWHRLFLFFSRWIRPPEDEYCSAPTPVRSSHTAQGSDPPGSLAGPTEPTEPVCRWLTSYLGQGDSFPFSRAYNLLARLSLKTIQLPYNNALLWNKRIQRRLQFSPRFLNNALPVRMHRNALASPSPLNVRSARLPRRTTTYFGPVPYLPPPGIGTKTNWVSHHQNIILIVSSTGGPSNDPSVLGLSIPASICWIAWKAWNAALYSSKSCSADSFFWDTQGLLKSRYLYHGSKLDPLERLNLHHLGLL